MLCFERVIVNEVLGNRDARLRRLILRGPIASQAQPGQFVHIKVSSQTDPLLRRPFSIFDIRPETEEITILYRIQGKGTELLANVSPGEDLSILGPLGNGFRVPSCGDLWLVAGGLGAFPLYALARQALRQGLKVRLYWGGENRGFLESAGLKFWQELGINLFLTTLDGSLGEKGLATIIFQQHCQDMGGVRPILVASCGPKGMMENVTKLCQEQGIPVEVSLEEKMGCGIGACLGCVCQAKDQNNSVRNVKVCSEGPVVRGEEVLWNAFS